MGRLAPGTFRLGFARPGIAHEDLVPVQLMMRCTIDKLIMRESALKAALCNAQSAARLRVPLGACQSSSYRAPNFYAHPGFERAGLRRRETEWIRARVVDRDSLFVPVWRSQSLVHRCRGRRAASSRSWAPKSVTMLLGASDSEIEDRLAHGHVVFLGLIDERAHFALDLSAHDAPLDRLRSPALAAAGIAAES